MTSAAMKRVVICGMRRSGRSHALAMLLMARIRQGSSAYAVTIDDVDRWQIGNLPEDEQLPCFAVTCLDPTTLPPAFRDAHVLDLRTVANARVPDDAGVQATVAEHHGVRYA